MLQKIRRTLAVLFFACITLLFLDFTGTLHAWLGWMARVQFLPAVLALNVGVVAALAVLTLLFGRVYCSVVCPLGVFQDLVAWLGGRGKRRKYRFSYSPARRWLRCGTLALFVAALVAGVGSLVACAVQRLRTYRLQLLPSGLSLGQQCAGRGRRACGKLCVL